MSWKNTNTGKSWRSYSSRRNGAPSGAKKSGSSGEDGKTYFASDLYENPEPRRSQIREFANGRNSWVRVGEILDGIYRRVLLAK
jgi:hypothetical protein